MDEIQRIAPEVGGRVVRGGRTVRRSGLLGRRAALVGRSPGEDSRQLRREGKEGQISKPEHTRNV